MRARLLVLCGLIGCTKEEVVELPPGQLLDLTAVDHIETYDAVGSVPLGGLVRTVNSVGASVPSASVSLSVGGVAQTVTLDGSGYGNVMLNNAGSQEVTGGATATMLNGVGVPWTGLNLTTELPQPLEATRVVGAHQGWLAAGDHAVWWMSPGQTPHTVLDLGPSRLIEGLRSVQVDLDGIEDALVWSGDTVYLLKGRPQGGLTWAAGVQAPGYIAADADIGDIDGDAIPDVVIAWTSQNSDHHVQVLLGDGLWGFTYIDPKPLAAAPEVMAVGNVTAMDLPQVTVVQQGVWTRLIWSGSMLVETGPELAGELPNAAELWSGRDIDGDGADELTFVGPYQSGAAREVRVYDLVGDSITVLPLNPIGGYIGFSDFDGDGLSDIGMMQEDGSSVTVTRRNDAFKQVTAGLLNDHGPIGLSDTDADTIPEWFLAGDRWRIWDGERYVSDEDGATKYRVRAPGVVGTGLLIAGPVLPLDLDNNLATTEMVTVDAGASSSRLLGFTVTPGPTPAINQSLSVALPGGGAAVDVAVCDGIAWILTATDLHRVDIATATRTTTVPALASRVECGVGPSGAAAGVLQNGGVTLLDVNGAVISTVAAAGAVDFAFVDLGAGPEVRTCNDEDCTAVRWTVGDGLEGVVVNDGDGLWVDFGVGPEPLGGAGTPAIVDVDHDGNNDVIAVDSDGTTSTVAVWRSTGSGFGASEAGFVNGAFEGPAVVGDVNGDGLIDVWGSHLGELVVTARNY